MIEKVSSMFHLNIQPLPNSSNSHFSSTPYPTHSSIASSSHLTPRVNSRACLSAAEFMSSVEKRAALKNSVFCGCFFFLKSVRDVCGLTGAQKSTLG